jgi:ABC-type multidrug transport system fused ATPase/permease subunit
LYPDISRREHVYRKTKEGFVTICLAIRYSIAFCLKYDKYDSVVRLILAGTSTLVLYLTIQSTGMIMNAVQHASRNPWVLAWPIAFLAFARLVEILVSRAAFYFTSKWRHVLRTANRHDIDMHRGSLDVASFRSKRYDDLDNQIRELPQGWYTRVAFAEQLFDLFSLFASFVIFGCALLAYKPLYALVLLAVAIPKLVSEFGVVAMWWRLYEDHIPHYKVQGMLSRPFKAPIAFVQAKMFGQIYPLGKLMWSREEKVIETYNRTRIAVSRQKIGTHLLVLAGFAGVVLHASWHTIVSGGAIGTLSVIIASANTFQGNLNAMVMLMADQWNSAKGVILIEREFKGQKPLLETPHPVKPEFTNPMIRFDRVSFAYPSEPDKEVLHEVSFEIEAGSRVAIVGKSGNGKSTIQALLMRHYDPSQGAIYADNINLRNIEPEVWNSYATSLTQKYTIAERPVGEEIASSRLDEPMSEERVLAAAEFAHFHDVVLEDAQGYERQIGTDFDGREFSGGEEQRLALARMYYRNTPIIILDEPDARLDPDSAEKVMKNIFAVEGKTVIIITHHVSRAEHCDKVIVMGKGTLAESGSPQELMARGGVYATMCASDKKRLGTTAQEEAEEA